MEQTGRVDSSKLVQQKYQKEKTITKQTNVCIIEIQGERERSIEKKISENRMA